MKIQFLFVVALVAFALLDIFGARYLNRNSVSQHALFSSTPDHRPNVWPFELFLSPSHKLEWLPPERVV
jgi:hypothetical protein